MQATPYLNFNGNCREAFEYYAEVLGGKIEAMMTYGDSPAAGDTSPDQEDYIMHAYLVAGDVVLMASDVPPDMFQKAQGLYVSLHIDDPDEAERVFTALADGGEIKMPFEETFWARGFGMATDRFGTPWMVNCSKPE